MAGLLQVAVAVIEDDRGRILLGRRAAQSHQGGLWEFPGGKLEAGETTAEALRREIAEEIGIEVLGHRPLIRIDHHYFDRSVRLDVQRVTAWRGEPRGVEGQPLAWVEPQRLADYPMPAADRPIVTALRLPDRYLITGPDPRDPERFCARLEQALADGVRLVQLRAPGLGETPFRALARRVAGLCGAAGAELLLNGPPEWVDECGCAGVHLNRHRLMALGARPLPQGKWVAASCHDAAELARAEAIGADFVVLSSVLPTSSHPDAAPLGWPRFAALAGAARLPVYALGGMRPEMIGEAWRHGGQGIAAIGSLWGMGAGRRR